MLSQLKDALNRKKNSMMVEEKYTEEQMKLRQEVLKILFKKFGNGSYSNRSIYECADEWIEKFYVPHRGIMELYKASHDVIEYYKTYFDK